jgi:hypothetical protein
MTDVIADVQAATWPSRYHDRKLRNRKTVLDTRGRLCRDELRPRLWRATINWPDGTASGYATWNRYLTS